jgi:hypothetical protein
LKNIEKPVGNALSEWLGAEKVDYLKNKIIEKILEQVEHDLANQYDLTIDASLINDISLEALEEVSKKIKKMYKDKYLEIAEQAIANIK